MLFFPSYYGSLVLRDDAGVISFVKYVSSAAPGSRFDVVGEYSVDASEGGGRTSKRGNGGKVDNGDISGTTTQATKKTRHTE